MQRELKKPEVEEALANLKTYKSDQLIQEQKATSDNIKQLVDSFRLISPPRLRYIQQKYLNTAASTQEVCLNILRRYSNDD